MKSEELAKNTAIITTPLAIPQDQVEIVTRIRDRALSLVIASQDGLRSANDALGVVRDYDRAVHGWMDKRVSAAHCLHKGLVADLKELTAVSDEADKLIVKAIGAYGAKIKEEARQAQARRDAEEREARESEQLEVAATIESAGDAKLAMEVLNQPITYATPKAPPVTLGVQGLTTVERFSAQVASLADLASYIATGTVRPLAHPDLITFLLPSMPDLNRQARKLGTALNIPGVKLVSETGVRRTN